MCRKRNVSDGDSGFDSALSSRSSSISLDQESPDFGKSFFSPPVELLSSKLNSSLRTEFQDILTPDEDIEREEEDLFLITNKITGVETLFKPPSRLKFSRCPPEVATTHSPEEYDRNNSIPRSALFHARLEYELEKQIAKMDLVEVDLVMESGVTPPPSLGIRVIGVNMIHGVPDKLNIYVKRIVEDSVAGCDGRIRVNDHIVEVNGISLVGVSQKLASQTLSNCAICPDTGTVHFVLARPPKDALENSKDVLEDSKDSLETYHQDSLENCSNEALEKPLKASESALPAGSRGVDKNFQPVTSNSVTGQVAPVTPDSVTGPTNPVTYDSVTDQVKADPVTCNDVTGLGNPVTCNDVTGPVNPVMRDSVTGPLGPVTRDTVTTQMKADPVTCDSVTGSVKGCDTGPRGATQSPHSFLKAQAEPDFVGRDAVRLNKKNEERSKGDEEVMRKAQNLRVLLRLSKMAVFVYSLAILGATQVLCKTQSKLI